MTDQPRTRISWVPQLADPAAHVHGIDCCWECFHGRPTHRTPDDSCDVRECDVPLSPVSTT